MRLRTHIGAKIRQQHQVSYLVPPSVQINKYCLFKFEHWFTLVEICAKHRVLLFNNIVWRGSRFKTAQMLCVQQAVKYVYCWCMGYTFLYSIPHNNIPNFPSLPVSLWKTCVCTRNRTNQTCLAKIYLEWKFIRLVLRKATVFTSTPFWNILMFRTTVGLRGLPNSQIQWTSSSVMQIVAVSTWKFLSQRKNHWFWPKFIRSHNRIILYSKIKH